MLYLIIDFETNDPYLGKDIDLGPGWVFSVANPTASLFYCIGYSYRWYDDTDRTYSVPEYVDLLDDQKEHGIQKLKDLLSKNTPIVMHNAQYDLGCMRSLGISIKGKVIYDTMVMGKLYDSTLFTYSLDALAKKYLGSSKANSVLIDMVMSKNLAPHLKPQNKTFERELLKWAKSNMAVIQRANFKAMANYANQDVIVTSQLFPYLLKRLEDKIARHYSNIQLICTAIREPGILVNMANIERGIELISPVLIQTQQEIFKAFKTEINLESHKQLAEQMAKLGYQMPQTPAGNDSVNKEFLEEHPTDLLCQRILKYRTCYKLLNDFLIKTKDMQKYSCPEVSSGSEFGRVFPQMNLLEARTGRFSSSCPNIQNIPKRDKEFAKLCRAMFTVTNPDNHWYSLDWSNQEGRLQLHYGYLNKFTKTQYWLDKFIENPKLDTHRLTAEMMFNKSYPLTGTKEVQKEWEHNYRTPAKTIYLGKSFCMGEAKTCKRLGLPTKFEDKGYGLRECAGMEGARLIKAYDNAFPYLKELQKDCMSVIKKKGYIKTIGGRNLKRPLKIQGRDVDYKAISLLIQGSAADQMYNALTLAYDAGIDIKCIVHDEFNIEGQDKDAKLMREIMEHSVEMVVPSIAEIKKGKTWGDLKELNDDKSDT